VSMGGEGAADHDRRLVDDDLLALPGRRRHLPPPASPVQPQGELLAVAVQLHPVPVPVVQPMVGQREVVVAVAQVEEDRQQALKHLQTRSKTSSHYLAYASQLFQVHRQSTDTNTEKPPIKSPIQFNLLVSSQCVDSLH